MEFEIQPNSHKIASRAKIVINVCAKHRVHRM